MKKSRLILFVAFAALAVTLAFSLASCGGGDGDATTTTASVTTVTTTTTAATTTAVPEYTATFEAYNPAAPTEKLTVDGATVTYKSGDTVLDPTKIPDVPAVDGYVGEWGSYYLAAGGTRIVAVYTSLTEGSKGLVFEKNEAGDAYTVIGYSSLLTQVVIPATYRAEGDAAALPVTAIGERAFWGSGIVGLYLPSSVTEIGAQAFSHCARLTTLSLPAVKKIGNYAFFSCEALTTFTLPSATTEIGAYAFGECISLATLTFPADTAVTRIGKGAFSSCIALTSLEIPTPAVNRSITLDAYAFLGCSALTTLSLPTSIASTSMSTVFFGCTAIETVTCSVDWLAVIPKESLTAATLNAGASLGEATLAGAYSLASLDLGATVTLIDANAFRDCVSLSAVAATGNSRYTVSNGLLVRDTTLVFVPVTTTGAVDLTGITAIGNYAFYGVAGLTSIDLTGITSIGDFAFFDCTGLTEVTIPAGCTVGKNAFQNCAGITTLTVAADCTVGTGAFLGCDAVTKAVLPTTALASLPKENLECVHITAGDTIARRAFYGQTKLSHVVLAASVTKVGQNAFFGCENAAIFCEFAETAVTDEFVTGWNGNCTVYYAGEWSEVDGVPAPLTPPAQG